MLHKKEMSNLVQNHKAKSLYLISIIVVWAFTKLALAFVKSLILETTKTNAWILGVQLSENLYLTMPPSKKSGYIAFHMSVGRSVRPSVDKPCSIIN